MAAAADLVRPGGTVVYSVCTLTAAETTGNDEWLELGFYGSNARNGIFGPKSWGGASGNGVTNATGVQIKEITEDAAAGSMTIVLEV